MAVHRQYDIQENSKVAFCTFNSKLFNLKKRDVYYYIHVYSPQMCSCDAAVHHVVIDVFKEIQATILFEKSIAGRLVVIYQLQDPNINFSMLQTLSSVRRLPMMFYKLDDTINLKFNSYPPLSFKALELIFPQKSNTYLIKVMHAACQEHMELPDEAKNPN